MIPQELTKPIDEIKTPSNKILIICLVSAVMFLTSLLVWKWKGDGADCATRVADKDIEIRRLNKYIIDKQDEDNQRLKRREAFMDSVNNIMRTLKNDLK